MQLQSRFGYKYNSARRPCSPTSKKSIMSDPIVVTGIQTGIPPHAQAADYPARLEWNEFVQNKYFVTLFAQALKMMQGESQDINTPLSYFQIAGMAFIGLD